MPNDHMKYLIEMELTPNQIQFIRSCGIERVFNMAIRLVNQTEDEDRFVSEEELETIKPFIRHLWITIQETTMGGTGKTGPMPAFKWWQ